MAGQDWPSQGWGRYRKGIVLIPFSTLAKEHQTMWRLMLGMVVISDAGGVAVVADHTDWSSRQECEQMIAHLYSTPEQAQLIGNVRVTVKTKAQCVPVGGAYEAPVVNADPMPPPPPPPPGYREPPPPPPGYRGGFPSITLGPNGLRVGPGYRY